MSVPRTESQHAEPEQAAQQRGALSTPAVRGTLLGLTSAVAYSAANVALRDLSRTSGAEWAVWVSAVKAVPCFLVSLGLVWYRSRQGLPALPPRETRGPLLVAAITMQIGGNVAFTWALSMVGLVLTVPLTFASLICSSALLGRAFLGEPIDRRTVSSMAVLLVSIICLSAAAQGSVPDADWMTILSGLGLASISGLSYGANSIVLRRYLGQQSSVSSLIVFMSGTGVVLLGVWGLIGVGMERLAAVTADQWQAMACAGAANAIAFYAVSGSLRYIPAVRANLINASQTAMCGLAGVLLFQELLTPLLGTGIGLTIAGLLLLGIRTPASRRSAAAAE